MKVKLPCPHCAHPHADVEITPQHKKATCEKCKKYIRFLSLHDMETLPQVAEEQELHTLLSQVACDNIMSCSHRNLLAYEYEMGCRKYGDKAEPYMDWSSNVINAHRIRVRKFLCLDCREIITIPSDAKD